jgi:hypothetical protein
MRKGKRQGGKPSVEYCQEHAHYRKTHGSLFDRVVCALIIIPAVPPSPALFFTFSKIANLTSGKKFVMAQSKKRKTNEASGNVRYFL